MKMKRWIAKLVSATVISSVTLALVGCNKPVALAAAALPAPATVVAKPKPAPTPEDWKKALEGTYAKRSVENKGEGVESFIACFEPTPQDPKKKCGYIAFGTRDGFRKLRIFETGFPMMVGDGMSTYVSIKDSGSPVLLLGPYIFRDHWLFMNRVAIMVDGDVILDQGLNVTSAGHEIFPGGVQEHTDFIATSEQVEALRHIKRESNVVIRITGEKGYMTLSKSDTSDVKKKIIEVLRVYDTISNAVKDSIPLAQS